MREIKNCKFFAIVLASAFGLFISPVSYATGTSTASPKATATLAATCTIEAQNLAFGNLVLPISSQGASTSMSVLCSKNAPYKIGLAYGGQYGAGTQTVTTSWVFKGSSGACGVGGYQPGTGLLMYLYQDVTSTGTIVGSVCTTSNNGYGSPGTATVGATYTYGMMTGVSKGNTIAYSIQVPGNPGQVWNTNNYTYSSTGTGASQTIPVAGAIVPGQTGSSYPAPDTYMDTVTATVTF